MPEITVVVPVYNTQDYLQECLESLECQTMKDIEIIIVNDCTPDHAMEIAELFVKRDNRFRIINHEYNKSLGGARNTGIRSAKGSYIMFLDSDDYYQPDTIESLWKKAKETNAEMVFGRMNWVKDGIQCPVEYIEEKINRYKSFHLDNLRNINSSYWYIGQACNRVYKRELLYKNNILFPEGIYWEDVFFSTQVWHYSNNIGYVDQVVYIRRERTDINNPSIIQNYDMKKYLDRDIVMEQIYEFVSTVYKNNEDDKKIARNLIYRVFQTTKRILPLANEDVKEDVYKWFTKYEENYLLAMSKLK